jgi:hypothetical protein
MLIFHVLTRDKELNIYLFFVYPNICARQIHARIIWSKYNKVHQASLGDATNKILRFKTISNTALQKAQNNTIDLTGQARGELGRGHCQQPR